jgi:hypothetical protein
MADKKAWPSWIIFAGTMLLVIGGINAIEGLVAVIKRTYVVVVANQLYLVDVTSWGWTVLIFGVVLGLTGLGLLAGQTWARVTGIVVVALHAISQVIWIGAYPVWSLLMIALDTVVLFALSARWPGRVEESPYYEEAPPRVQPAQQSATVPPAAGR